MNPQDFILSRSGRARRTRAGYWAYWPDPLPPPIEWSADLLHQLSEAERSLGGLVTSARLLSTSSLFSPLLAAREACYSCQIDGIQVDLLEFLQSRHFPGDPSVQTPEIHAAGGALESLRTASNPAHFQSPLTLEMITVLHSRLFTSEAMASGNPGMFRSAQNWIGSQGSSAATARFVPPPADRLDRSLEQLALFINRHSALPPVARLGLIHYQFEALHPFSSGNGRLGRVLVSSLPIFWGDLSSPLIHISEFFLANRQIYFDLLLAVSQRSAWTEWLVFFLDAITQSTRRSAKILLTLHDQHRRHQDTISSARSAPRLQRLLGFVAAQPIFNVRQAEAALGVNFPVAQRYVNQFVEFGIVEEVTGQSRNRIYRASGVLEILIG